MAIKTVIYSLLWLILCTCFGAGSAETSDCNLDPVSHKEARFNPPPDLSDGVSFSSAGYISRSHNHLLTMLSEGNQTLSSTEIKTLLRLKLSSYDSCKSLPKMNCNIPQLSVMRRNLVGDGSHRRLITSAIFEIPPHGMCELDAFDCTVVLIESLSTGLFADSFELSRLVDKRVYRDAEIYGDKNLELPSLLSNRSTVEIHLNTEDSDLFTNQRHRLSCELPLHARYPPLDSSGYSRVEIGPPNVAMLCKPKHSEEIFYSFVYIWDVSSEERVVWDVPSGNQEISALVSSITLASALISALAIVYVSVNHACSAKKHAKIK
ncbi:phosphatidylinositol-glycan biosynthesis class X-like protein [Wolffia australiana]